MASTTKALVLLIALVLVAQQAWAVSYEYMIPMRDGVKLHTMVDIPPNVNGTVTACMDRSPYGEGATELIATVCTLFGKIGIRQDMRGTKKSEGNFTIWHSDCDDAYDTMEWISKQPWSNGKVISVGASADGIAAFTQPMSKPKWLSGQFIIFATSVGYDTIFPGGAYQEALTNMWMQTTVPSQAPACIHEIQSNEAPGAWWNPLNMTGHYQSVNFPAVFWAGWYDIFLMGNLVGFDSYQHLSAPGGLGKSQIVVDPLGHCQEAAKYFPKNLIAGRSLLPITLGLNLIQDNKPLPTNVSAITFYVMGAFDDVNKNYGNYWTTMQNWPVPKTQTWYFHGNGTLSPSKPGVAQPSTTYIYRPEDPVPTIGGNNLALKCGPLDQTPVEKRSDVVLFTSAPFTQPFALTGPLDATLYVSSNATDTDFMVKITDVYPDGRSILIIDGATRMRWRNVAHSNVPQPMSPGTVYEINVSLWNTSYVFSPGHKMRISVTSSNAPRYSVNPNNGLKLVQNGLSVWAANTLHHATNYPSSVSLPVVSLSQLPEHKLLSSMSTEYTQDQIKMAIEAISYKGEAFSIDNLANQLQAQKQFDQEQLYRTA